MTGYQQVRDELKAGLANWRHLNARQLFKHALALRTAVHKENRTPTRTPVLYYLYAEPKTWPKRPPAPVDKSAIERHREETARFAAIVANDEVAFRSGTYRELLDEWRKSPEPSVSAHAAATLSFFDNNI